MWIRSLNVRKLHVVYSISTLNVKKYDSKKAVGKINKFMRKLLNWE
jgi:hypothetical protein